MDDKQKEYVSVLALKGVSAVLAALGLTIREGAARPTDEMISDALYMLEVVTDQVAYDIEQHEGKEIARLAAISKETGIPMKQLLNCK